MEILQGLVLEVVYFEDGVEGLCSVANNFMRDIDCFFEKLFSVSGWKRCVRDDERMEVLREETMKQSDS